LSVSPHEKEIFRMSYRDAYDRTERVASSVEARQRTEALKNLLERAARSGDTQQADAVYHLAVERGLFDVADAYRETRLKTKERWETYAAARHEAESLASRLFGWVGPRKTHEFGDPLRGEGFSETG
jgi:leucyl aminopeptidase (aminopeptidase T)